MSSDPVSSDQAEIEAIRKRYARRTALSADRYSRLNPDVMAGVHERQRALSRLFRAHRLNTLAGLDIMEVGCGSGGNLLEFIGFGAEPGRLAGNELLDERLALARANLPAAVRLYPGDASTLVIEEGSFDIVFQSVVFSSILDDELQRKVAAAMWRWLRPGGAILWYDFTFDNPRNPDVRGVTLKRIRELFAGHAVWSRRLTLAPPIARRVAAIHPLLYSLFNQVPALRTHLLCWIEKA